MAVPKCRDCGSTSWTDEGRCSDCDSFPTLGFAAADWIESYCVIPDREDAGLPFRLTDEQLAIVLRHYRVNPHAVADKSSGKWMRAFHYERGTQITKPQKWGKAPVSAAFTCVEAAPDGPVLFDGWDADGLPVGRSWASPHVQVTACSEDQTDNVWRVLLPMIQLGPLADVFRDSGLTRINLPGGGLIEPVTAAAVSRLGQRVTCAIQDQTESWLRANGGHKLADNQRRGLAGTGGRFVETPNAWDPAEDSVAQRTYGSKKSGVYCTWKEPMAGSVRNKRERDKVLREQYGDSVIEKGGWIDIGRIHTEIEALLEFDPAQGERWFMNRVTASEGAAFDVEKFKEHSAARKVEPGAIITLGADGARHDDAIAVVATEVKTGYQWPVIVIERPDDAGEDYEHDLDAVDGAVREAFETYNVWRMYCDPHWIEALIDGWSNKYGERVVVHWYMNRPRPVAWAIRNWAQAIVTGEATNSGDDTFVRHVANTRKRKLTVLDDNERQMHTIAKDAVGSPRKIDCAAAAVLSWEARGDCIKAGGVSFATEQPPDVPVEPPKFGMNFAPPASSLVGAPGYSPNGNMS